MAVKWILLASGMGSLDIIFRTHLKCISFIATIYRKKMDLTLWYGGSYAFLPVFEPRTETDDAFTEGYG
jgi:hypothetical protein